MEIRESPSFGDREPGLGHPRLDDVEQSGSGLRPSPRSSPGSARAAAIVGTRPGHSLETLDSVSRRGRRHRGPA